MDIHTLCVPLNQRIRALNRAKSAGFMPRDGGLQYTDVRIPDSLSERVASAMVVVPETMGESAGASKSKTT